MKKTRLISVWNPFGFLHRFLTDLGSITYFAWTAVATSFAPPYKRSITRKQIDEIGFNSLPIITLTGLFMGLVLGMQSIVELRSIGATSYIGRPIGTTVIRELGPVLTAIMVAARAGSAIAAELASMCINEQIDAMRAEGSHPVKKLVQPRLMACALSVPILTAICDFVAFVGGWVIATQVVQVSSAFYWDSVMEVLTPAFIYGGLIKALAFGFVIGAVSCHAGMTTRSDAAGVGEATTRSVVISCIVILMLDFLLTKIFIITWW